MGDPVILEKYHPLACGTVRRGKERDRYQLIGIGDDERL